MCRTGSWPALFSFSLIQYHYWELFLNFMKTRLGHKHVLHLNVFKELELKIIQTRKTWRWKLVCILSSTPAYLRLVLTRKTWADSRSDLFRNGRLASQSGKDHNFFFQSLSSCAGLSVTTFDPLTFFLRKLWLPTIAHGKKSTQRLPLKALFRLAQVTPVLPAPPCKLLPAQTRPLARGRSPASSLSSC